MVIAPPALAPPRRTWGWMLQLYALHSAGSWGIGDLGDLRAFTTWTGTEHGAGAVLLNPLHAMTPVPPVQPSPYTPSSRRFGTPLALRITDLDAYARADRADPSRGRRAAAGDHRRSDRARSGVGREAGRLRAAVAIRWAPGAPRRRRRPVGVRHLLRVGRTLRRALEPVAGSAAPPVAPGGGGGAHELAPRVAFHAWLQQQVQLQLTGVRDRRARGGVTVIHDLAVGCDPEGADGWALQDVLAGGVRVGAPPDAFSQQGQDWGLPPWRPDRLAATGYASYRDLLRALVRQADGLRIDHVAGLWRLWWVPPGESADRGTYVHYDSEVMLAVLTLEAHRAGALVIGEDLGTVEPEVTAGLEERNMLGSSVLWFTRDYDAPGAPLLPPAEWSEESVATVSTHDLPTVLGFLRGEHVRARAELGLLDDVAAEEAKAAADREQLIDLLRAEGLVSGEEPGEDQLVVAVHAVLARARSRLALVSPYDVIGETRQPNLPGTVDQYPNWRLPLPEPLEELRADPRVRTITDLFRQHR